MGEKMFAKDKQSGAVLLESLIAILIFTIGILGLIGVFASSMKNVSEAQSRTEASFLVETLIAKMITADPATRATTYASPSGSEYLSWVNDRVKNSSTGLPRPGTPTVLFAGNQVTITLTWKDRSDSPQRTYTATTSLE